jgi:NitT/TauT family transport system substrate-binding protein
MLSQLLAMKSGKSFKVLYSSKDAPGVITDVLVFDDRFIQAHPKEIETLVKVYLDALAYVKAKPDESAKIIAKVMSITPKEVKEQMPLVRNLQPADIRKAFAKSSEPLSFFGSGPLIGEILKARGEVKVVPAIEDTLEPKFVNAVLGK